MDYWGGGGKGYVAPPPPLKLLVGPAPPPSSYAYDNEFYCYNECRDKEGSVYIHLCSESHTLNYHDRVYFYFKGAHVPLLSMSRLKPLGAAVV